MVSPLFVLACTFLRRSGVRVGSSEKPNEQCVLSESQRRHMSVYLSFSIVIFGQEFQVVSGSFSTRSSIFICFLINKKFMRDTK